MHSKSSWLAFALAALLLGGSAAWADGDFYVVAGGGPPVGTKITSLPAGGLTISQPGFYFLGCNLTYNSTTNPAITISQNNVTLDLMGFSLTGPGPGNTVYAGIYIKGQTNVEIRNGTVGGFNAGIEEDSGNKHRVINMRLTSNNDGVYLGGNNHLIKNCSATGNNMHGLVMTSSGMITDCVANDNKEVGIILYGYGSVLGNSACNNTNFNFYLGSGYATSILVDRNSAYGQSTNYYKMPGTSGVVITANNSGTP